MKKNTPKRVVILGRSVATVGESLREGTACNTPDLLSPSGPFSFASDAELEAIEAEQAGVIR